jgi:hypothetical protein
MRATPSKAARSWSHRRNSQMPQRLTIFGVLGLLAAGCGAAAAQNAGAAPNLSGFWELRFDSRHVPEASLTPAAAAESKSEQARHDRTAIRWCHFLGVPFLMGESPLDVLQGRNGKQVIIASPAQSLGRHIYTDGRQHPNQETFDPTSNGDSIGHWEGDTLVVDTIGFSDQGVTSIPGGGRRTGASHLVERFRLLDGGNRLSVTFTWEDPKIFQKPHTYRFIYYRAPKGTEAREFGCNASDEERAKFLLEPPQS